MSEGDVVGDCYKILENIPLTLCQYLVENQYHDVYVCFASFVAQDVGDLSITEGDIIIATNTVNEHWMQGQVCYDSQAKHWPCLTLNQQGGSFPLNHCDQLDVEWIKSTCQDRVKKEKELELQQQQQQQQNHQQLKAIPPRPPLALSKHSSSLSSGSSSLHSTDYQHLQLQLRQQQPQTIQQIQPPPRPQQLPIQSVKHAVEHFHKPTLSLSTKQQDKLKGWLHTVKKKTARLSTRITASLGLISLTRDEEFERHYEDLKHIEKTIRTFIKNLTTFVEHFENFLAALQQTSENLAGFYRDKSHQKELEELRKKNRALACEHFHAFKRAVDRQVVTVASQLLQRFAAPQQLINKRSAKLLDYDNKTKELETCRDIEKKTVLRDQFVIAKDIYDRINRQLIEELPIFNQLALDIFKDCILVLLESRRNLILSYTNLTASLLDTPLMMTYTASDVASSIFMSCELAQTFQAKQNIEINEILEQDRKDSGRTSGHGTKQSSANGDDFSRPQSVGSQLSSEFDQMALAAREISSTPLSHVSETQISDGLAKVDEVDGIRNKPNGLEFGDRRQTLDEGTNSEDVQPVKRDTVKERKKRKCQIYIASWPFVATGPNQLTITCQQPLKLIKGCDECGNSDWSLVQDKKGQLGYVPTSYIKKRE